MSQSSDTVEAPVVIVGAGPVGLALAIDLASRGIDFIQIDRSETALDFPTSEAIFVRTMEHFRRWGLADALRQAGFPPELKRNVYFMTRILGHELLRIDRPSNREQKELSSAVSPEGAMWCPKKLFEPIMRRHVRESRYARFWPGWEMLRFEQDETGVRLDVQHVATGEKRQLKAQFLAACDGASSSIRKSLGIEMQGTFAEGHNLGIYFRSPALSRVMAARPGVMVDIMNPDATANLSTVDGGDLWRLIRMLGPSEVSVTPQDCLQAAFGGEIEVDIIDARPWAGHTVVADRFRDGRVILVGDAAHLLWPRGGFGMNTGIGDAVDISWKLQAVLNGWGGKTLLDSYTAERKPVAARNVAEAASNYKAQMALRLPPEIEAETPAGAAARKALGETIRERRSKEWNTIGVQLGYVYEASPVIANEPPPPASAEPFDPGRYDPTTRPGARAPHAWLSEEGPQRSLLDCFGAGFTLVHAPGADPVGFSDAARGIGLPLKTFALETAEQAALYERAFVLVRPDGHVAWRGDAVPADPLSVLNLVRGH